ncbi:MAG: hypothetical protein HYR88_03415 [Verrucomicrobia bacterium]|nr:hypothetical protein [Verrucomicrobiota bacterium]MBI3871155.1 hypothetical protein [Verrucomicrobiota bacterium]
MKSSTWFKTCLATASALALAFTLSAADSPAKDSKEKAAKAKPYPLKTCIVSDEKLDADPSMKSVAFNHEGQEIKLCCKSCMKDFKKDPAKYVKKLNAAANKDDKAKKKA